MNQTHYKPADILKFDIPAGLAVFFVAIPLCLGIAHASGAPLLSGLITGIIGGTIVASLSKSQLSVSGPAAGLTAIAIAGIQDLGSFEAFLTATALAGVFQIFLGIAKAGSIANYVPNNVIRGMLSGIGLLLIIKQFPHLIGYDVEEMGVEEFNVATQDLVQNYHDVKESEQNSFTIILHALSNLNPGIFIIGFISLLFLIAWDKLASPKLKSIPSSLIVVLLGVFTNYILEKIVAIPSLSIDHFVNIPSLNSIDAIKKQASSPDLSMLFNYKTFIVALTVGIVASIETLLSTEAIDKLDPQKRNTPPNRELIAQGTGNFLCGILGGLPMTAVIVRGSVNVTSGAKTKFSSIFHGLLILTAAVFFAPIMNMIPLAALAAILVYTGFKLIDVNQIAYLYKKGWDQLLPFLITVIAIISTDLLIGVLVGIGFAMLMIIREDFKAPVIKLIDLGSRKRIVLGENVTFLHKQKVVKIFESIPDNSFVEVDGSRTSFVDKDVSEFIAEYRIKSIDRNINVIIGGLNLMENSNNNSLKESMKKSYEILFENNKKWVEEKTKVDPNFFMNLSKGQTPQYLWIGCSDSRVPANEITGTDPGDMFVHRNIANLVVNTDVNLLSVLQYSVEVLNIKHIIVCGHYGCGGVKAAMENKSHGLIDKWLRNIKDVYRLHKSEVDSINDKEMQHRKMVELNVREQVTNLMKTAIVQKNRELYGFPEVHGWVYDLSNGLIVDLKIDVEKEFPDFNSIYKFD